MIDGGDGHGVGATQARWTWRWSAGASVVYLLLAVVLTWPLATNLTDALPADHASGGTVPLFDLWTLEWNAHSLRNGYAGYWDAPIFYPDRAALALSEPMPLPGVAFAGLEAVTASPVVAYDVVLLLALVLNGLAVLWLGRRLGLPAAPSLVAGLLGVSLPFVLRQLGVLQLVMVFPLVFTLGASHGFAQRPTRGNAVRLGAWIGITFLCCGYYAVFLGLLLPVVAAAQLRRELLRTTALASAVLAALVAALLVAPVASFQAAVVAGYSRDEAAVTANSARPADYLELNPGAWGAGVVPWVEDGVGGGERLYPGTGLLLLAAAGAFIAWRHGHRRWLLMVVAGALIAFTVSLALNLRVAGIEPYRLLMDFWPGFRTLRNPWRMAVMVQVFALCLAPVAVAWLWRYYRLWRVLAVLLVLASVAEVAHAPIALYPYPDAHLEEGWVDWLSRQPAGAVAMIPFSASPDPRAYEPIVIAMLQGLEHGKPLVNGYSGFLPERYWQLRNLMLRFPDGDSMAALLDTGAAYLAVDRTWLTPGRREALERAGCVPLYADSFKTMYRLPTAGPATG